MITQDIIDKLKANEIPYGILKTKDWFTDEVDKFMKDNIKNLLIYEPTGWKDKTTDYFLNRSIYRLKQDYVLHNNKEVYSLLPINTDGITYFVIIDDISDNLNDIKTYNSFLGFWFGTKEEFDDFITHSKNIDYIPNSASSIYYNFINSKFIKGKIVKDIAKYVIMKGKDYE